MVTISNGSGSSNGRSGANEFDLRANSSGDFTSSFVETEANFFLGDNFTTNFVVSGDSVEVNFDIGDNSTTTIDASGATNDATDGSNQGDDRNAFRLGSGQETITDSSGADLFEVRDSTDLTATDSLDRGAGDFDAQELNLAECGP